MVDSFRRDTFIFYRSFFEAIKDLSPEDQATLFCAVCELALNGNETELNGICKTIFRLIKPQIEANNRKFVNGCKGGRPITKSKPKNNQIKTKE